MTCVTIDPILTFLVSFAILIPIAYMRRKGNGSEIHKINDNVLIAFAIGSIILILSAISRIQDCTINNALSFGK